MAEPPHSADSKAEESNVEQPFQGVEPTIMQTISVMIVTLLVAAISFSVTCFGLEWIGFWIGLLLFAIQGDELLNLLAWMIPFAITAGIAVGIWSMVKCYKRLMRLMRTPDQPPDVRDDLKNDPAQRETR